MTQKISDIVSDLMKTGAMMPDISKCNIIAADMIINTQRLNKLQYRAYHADEYGFDTLEATESIRSIESAIDRWSKHIPEDKLKAIREEIHKIIIQLPAARYIPREDYEKVPSFENLSNIFSMLGFEAAAQCACIKKGSIVANLYHMMNTYTVAKLATDTEQKNLLWKEIIISLEGSEVLTTGEADRLLKVRW